MYTVKCYQSVQDFIDSKAFAVWADVERIETSEEFVSILREVGEVISIPVSSGVIYRATEHKTVIYEMFGEVIMKNKTVRKDFDKSIGYRVCVHGLSEEEKKEVQQAFFDVGLFWASSSMDSVKLDYKNLEAFVYSNVKLNFLGERVVVDYLLYNPLQDNKDKITPEEFFKMVYEDSEEFEERTSGHPNWKEMKAFAEESTTSKTPWDIIQYKPKSTGLWHDCHETQLWIAGVTYRVKPKVHFVCGKEIPDLRFNPKNGEKYFTPRPVYRDKVQFFTANTNNPNHNHRADHRLCYKYSEEGKHAAKLHSEAWLSN